MIADSIQSIRALLLRDLDRLKREIEGYSNEADLWLVPEGISNSAGNLCLHICGNLQHFVGAMIGNSGYERNRDEEFNLKNVSVQRLIEEIESTRLILDKSLERFTEEKSKEQYPIEALGYPMSHSYFLIHLVGHLNYHLGQINYHRRLLAN